MVNRFRLATHLVVVMRWSHHILNFQQYIVSLSPAFMFNSVYNWENIWIPILLPEPGSNNFKKMVKCQLQSFLCSVGIILLATQDFLQLGHFAVQLWLIQMQSRYIQTSCLVKCSNIRILNLQHRYHYCF